MSAPRCTICDDTGEVGQRGSLDCRSCNAAETRMRLNAHMAFALHMPVADRDWAVFQYAQSLVRLPSTPEEAVAFIGPNFDAYMSTGAIMDHRFKLSVHDLLTAFRDHIVGRAAIAASQQAAPKVALTDEQIMEIFFNAQKEKHGSTEEMIMRSLRAIEAAAGPNAALVAALQAIIAKYHSGQMVGGCAEIEAARAALASLPPTQEA